MQDSKTCKNKELFKEPKEIKISTNDKKKYFDVPENQLVNLRFTDVSLYSSTPTDQAKYTADLLLSYYTLEELKEKTLMDATACIGGNTWIFAELVGKVICNDISVVHYEILKNNMHILGKNNVEVLNENYLDVYLNIEQDILFFDPPWGGVDYKAYSEIGIQLTDSKGVEITLSEIIVSMLQYKCETMILKLPVNYFIDDIIGRCNYRNIDNLIITSHDKRPLYRLVVLSHLKRLKKPETKVFRRLGYKYIKIL